MTSRSTSLSPSFADRRLWRLVGWSVLAIAIALGGIYFAGRSGADPAHYSNDFNVFYYAAREVNAGRDPYQNSLGSWTPYLYPPLLAQLLAPLALLPLPAAAYLWFAINAAALIGASTSSARLAWMPPANTSEPGHEGTMSTKDTPRDWRRAVIAALGIAVVFRFSLDNFNLGQVNCLLAGLVAAHLYLCVKQRRVASALMLALAASIKLTPLLLIVYHLARRRVRFAVACAGLFVVITVISFSVYGSRAPTAFSMFFHRTVMNEQGFDFAYAGNQSLRGAIARIESRGAVEYIDELPGVEEARRRPSSPLTLIVGLALLISATVSARRRHHDDPDRVGTAPGEDGRVELAAAAPFVCLLVMLSPLSWKAHFVLLVIPAVSLIANANELAKRDETEPVLESAHCDSARTRRLIVMWVAVVIPFLLFNVTSPRVVGLAAAEWADAHSLVFAGGLLLFSASVWFIQRACVKTRA